MINSVSVVFIMVRDCTPKQEPKGNVRSNVCGDAERRVTFPHLLMLFVENIIINSLHTSLRIIKLMHLRGKEDARFTKIGAISSLGVARSVSRWFRHK